MGDHPDRGSSFGYRLTGGEGSYEPRRASSNANLSYIGVSNAPQTAHIAQLPSLTLQRPSYPNPSDLPPLEHIRPGSISDPRIPLGGLGLGHPPPARSPPTPTTVSGSFFAPPPVPPFSRRPSASAAQPHPPHFSRRPSYPSSSVPAHPSGLRYPARTSPSTSPKFDLSQYSMSTSDDKHRSSGSSVGATSPTSRSADGTSPGVRHGSTLPPLQIPAPFSPSHDGLTTSPRQMMALMSPSGMSSASGSARKREREDDIGTPGSSHSRASSAFVITPQMEVAEPPMKRRGSTLDSLLISDKEDIKPVVPTWNDWERRGSISSMLNATASEKEKSALEKVGQMPIGPISPVTAFPFQFGYSSTGPGTAPPSGTANGNANGQNAAASSSSIDRDPALSSVRSSAEQVGNGTGLPQQGTSSTSSPQVRFPDDTLHSAGGSPAPGVLEAALQQAAAMNADSMGSSSGSHSMGMSGHGQEHDSNRLSVPGSSGMDDDKKDQPFSRSPELRISHKLAERKRRKEMKDLFDELRDLLPAERGGKSSKWEILSKAIDYIVKTKDEKDQALLEVERLKKELNSVRGGAGFPTTYGGYNAASQQPGPQSGNTSAQAGPSQQRAPVPSVNVSGPGAGVGVGKQQSLAGQGSAGPVGSVGQQQQGQGQAQRLGQQAQVAPASLSAAAAAAVGSAPAEDKVEEVPAALA